jgi:hypothetical protein
MIDRFPEGDLLLLFCDTFLSGVETYIVYANERVKDWLSWKKPV